MRMMWFGGGAASLMVGFFTSFYMTFPEDAIRDRINVEVHKATAGAQSVVIESIKPSWMGVSLSGLVLKGERGGEERILGAIDRLKVRSSVLGLLRRTPPVMATMDLGGGRLEVEVATGIHEKREELQMRRLRVDAQGLPLSDLLAFTGTEADVSGVLDMEVYLFGEEGMRKSDGSVSLVVRDGVVRSFGSALPPLGFDVVIDEFDMRAEVDEGEADFTRGRIRTEMVQANVGGTVTLREDWARTGYRLDVVLDRLNLPDGLALLEGGMKSAKWGDGTYRYACNGTMSRLKGCTANPEGRSKSRATREREDKPRKARGANTPEAPTKDMDAIRKRLDERRAEREERKRERAEELELIREEEEFEELEELGYEEDEDEEELDDLFGGEGLELDEIEELFNE